LLITLSVAEKLGYVFAMVSAATLPYVSFRDYVVAEQTSEQKNEWLDGGIFAMAGGTPEHSALAAAIIGQLIAQLKGKPCRVFSSDLRIRVTETGLTTYPDISVVCGALIVDPEDPNCATNPTVIVEVLSSSTESYDRGRKFGHYKQMESLQHYVLVSQDRPYIEWFTRAPKEAGNGVWLHRSAAENDTVLLDAIECHLVVAEIFANPLSASNP
jgi:Uma2 family endonuclease